jgi:hypothetical protein
MATTFKLFADKMGGKLSSTYIGTTGEIFYDPAVGALKMSDGVTAGGSPMTVTAAPTDYAQTNTFFVDPARADSYTPSGTIYRPFKTITAAYTAAVTAGFTDANPAFIVLQGNITESPTFTQGGIFLSGAFGSGTHTGSPTITGNITINGSAVGITANHFAISNLRIVAGASGKGINFTGTLPQRLFMRDLWIDANGTGTCLFADNTGSGSVCHMNSARLTHAGTGDVYCIDATKGIVTVTDIETSGNVQVAAVRTGATLTLDGSEIDANNGAALEVYGGVVAVTNSIINNTFANSNGIALNTAGSIATLGNVYFSVPAGTGKAIYSVAGTFVYYQYLSFAPASNRGKSAVGTYTALETTLV